MIRSFISLGAAAAVAFNGADGAEWGGFVMGSFKIWSRRGKVDQLNMGLIPQPNGFALAGGSKRIAMIDSSCCKHAPYALAHLRIDTLISPFGPSAATTDYGGTYYTLQSTLPPRHIPYGTS